MFRLVSEPIERSTLSSIVTERIRELVTQGSYAPGAQLSEVELAERFQVSRGPVREALQRLVQEGLLRSEPHRGVSIPVVDARDVHDIYLAREAIEGAALKAIVAANKHGSVAERLKTIAEKIVAASEAERWSRVADLDMQFHLEIVRAAESPRLSRMFALLANETRFLLAMGVPKVGANASLGEHLEFAETLASGDFEAVRASVNDHFTMARDIVTAEVDQEAEHEVAV